MKTKIKSIGMALAIVIILSSTTFAMGIKAIRLAESRNIEGKGIYGECLPFAQSLNQKLQENGIESYFIEYSYETKSGECGAHAIVVFKDEKGQLWGIDNLSKAKRVYGNNSEEWVKSFYSGYKIVIVY